MAQQDTPEPAMAKVQAKNLFFCPSYAIMQSNDIKDIKTNSK